MSSTTLFYKVNVKLVYVTKVSLIKATKNTEIGTSVSSQVFVIYRELR